MRHINSPLASRMQRIEIRGSAFLMGETHNPFWSEPPRLMVFEQQDIFDRVLECLVQRSLKYGSESYHVNFKMHTVLDPKIYGPKLRLELRNQVMAQLKALVRHSHLSLHFFNNSDEVSIGNSLERRYSRVIRMERVWRNDSYSSWIARHGERYFEVYCRDMAGFLQSELSLVITSPAKLRGKGVRHREICFETPKTHGP